MVELIIDNQKTDYLIDESGKIYSTKTNKYLTGTIMNTGYRMVRLTTSSGKKGYAVHRLVAETFIPNPDNLPIVNHKDGNKINNNVSNLEWVTSSGNRCHAINTNLSNLAYGKRQQIQMDSYPSGYWRQFRDTNYYVSAQGEVVNKKTKILLKQVPRGDGYIRFSLRINNKSVPILGHIMVMETWGDKIPQLNEVINHKDGNKGNNNINNLEIISRKENALHACYALHRRVRPVRQYRATGEIVQDYSSVISAARALKITDGAIRYALSHGTQCKGYLWAYLD